MRALVVDDSAVILAVVSRCLERMAFEVTIACSGDVAWSRMQEITFDLVVADLVMPGMDGIELIQLIRARGDQTPVIVLTSMSDAETVERARTAGANAYLLKPFDGAILSECIVSLLSSATAF
jgi:DNA-binding response OmpR family regulator